MRMPARGHRVHVCGPLVHAAVVVRLKCNGYEQRAMSWNTREKGLPALEKRGSNAGRGLLVTSPLGVSTVGSSGGYGGGSCARRSF